MVTYEWDRDGPRYDFDLATLSRGKYFWDFWGQPIPTKTFCGQAADVHVKSLHWRHKRMSKKAFQDYYPNELSYCYGCGRLNDHGLQLKSHWDGEETVALFCPEPNHIAIPGYVYGGLIASLIDCHSTGTASAASYRKEGREMGTDPPLRFVTASLQVDYLRPTPLGVPLQVRGKVKELKGRKVVVSATVSAKGKVCARGKVVAVQMPAHMITKRKST